MGIALMFLLALYQMQSAIYSEIIDTPNYTDNALNELEDSSTEPLPAVDNDMLDAMMMMNEKPDQTELELRLPISNIGFDYGKNSMVLRLQKNARKPQLKYDPDYEQKRKSLRDNFMHFGKRQAEQLPQPTGPGYYEMSKRSAMDRYGREPKQDFMRFGRTPSDFMRFGRAPSDFMRFGRDPKQDFMRFGRDPKQDFMRFGRDPKQDFMRFGRDPKQDFMRFGRDPKQDFMRFGRDPKQDFMRFGRDPKQDFMRFGRADDFMRFGRNVNYHEEQRSSKPDFMRFGRPDNFMRFGRSPPTEFERNGKMDSNFMRFGKRSPGDGAAGTESNQTKAQLQQNKITADGGKQEQQQPSDDSNTVDKTITMLFDKHHQEPQQQQQQQQQRQPQEEQQLKSSEQNNLEEASAEQFFEP
ncbi:FMRFamide-related peptides isoform X2 [Drosophila grimshawi]|uniref:FMRFamide-related peptides isoform X2 n=1 Tax=Drosophila grimshawi TaxID=7222 RepID=UPI000C870070|nr:FMRFamide-related peptides isoform X2 [Drosophila grimshawi]